MDLSEILSITGKPGLFLLKNQTKNGIVVESLTDGKKAHAFANDKISSLEEISIFTTEDDMPLKEVFRAIFEKENGEATSVSHKSDNKTLLSYFGEVISNFDDERVYPSHVKKIMSWYNQLQAKGLLNFTDEEEEAPAENNEEKDAENNE